MRRYTLASLDARGVVDLRDFQDIIEDAIHEIVSSAQVTVEKDCYYVSPTPTKGEAIKIGRLICKSGLNRFCVQIPKLFSSVEIEEDKNDREEQKCNGGHF